MEDDGFWKDVEDAFHTCVMRKTNLPEDKMWDLAKKIARERYEIQKTLDRAKREGRSYDDVMVEDLQARRLRKEESEIN